MTKDYNTSRTSLKLKEYGRNVQKLVEYIKTFDDKDKRTKYAYTLTNLMKQIVPGPRDQQDNTQKFWDDMTIISDFDLDIDAPYPQPESSILTKKPKPLVYHNYKVRFKHYGRNVELLIDEAIKMEDGDGKQHAIIYIATLMKTFHITWNKENVDDKVILDNMAKISENKLVLDEKFKENLVLEPLYREKSKPKPRRNQGSNRNQNRRRRN